MRVDSFRMDEGEKQPINAIPSKKTIGMDHATRSLGLLAGQAKESPDCWDRCEETEQLFTESNRSGVNRLGQVLGKH